MTTENTASGEPAGPEAGPAAEPAASAPAAAALPAASELHAASAPRAASTLPAASELPAFPAMTAAPQTESGPVPSRRRKRRGFIIAGAAIVAAGVLAGGFWGWSVVARSDYDTATVSLADAQNDERDAVNAFQARMRSIDGVLARLQSVAAAPEFAADTSAEAEPLRTAITALSTVVGEVDDLREVTATGTEPDSGTTAPDATHELDGRTEPEGYRPPWELVSATEAATGDAREARDTADSLNTANDAAAEAQDALDDRENAYFEGLGARGTATIAASPLATKATQVDFTRLIEQASDPAGSSSHDGAFLSAFAVAERAVTDSQARMAAEQNDPSLAVRHEIEAYARSISNGMTLDFVWAPEVSGLGEGWLSGTAQTWPTDGGWAIISLNYPIETEWDIDRNPRAVVTHEVGHTQAYRDACWSLFSGPVFNSDDETWATAWAIGMGFDLPGSGIEAYGRPSDEQIEVAAQCR